MLKTLDDPALAATYDPSPVDAVPPPAELAALGLQHVLVMYAGAVAVPLIVGRALMLPPDQVAFLVSSDLFACGLASLVQSVGLPFFGIRLPVMMGVTFASVAPMMAMIAAGAAAGRAPADSLRLIYGSVIAAGLFAMVVAGLFGRLIRLFPPVVTGVVILVIGISLMRIGIDWAAGGFDSDPSYGSPQNLGVAGFVLACILAVNRWGRGFVRHAAVLIGLAAGCVLAALLGRMSFAPVAGAPLLGLVTPFRFGLPVFEPVSIATMCVVMLVVMVESSGMFLALGEMVGRPVTPRDLARGLRGDGLGTLIGGIFNTFPHTSFSQNVGLVGMTGVRSRFVCAAAAAIMLALGLCPKLGALVEAVPSFVLGGAGLVMFGMVAATGVRILSKVDYADRNSLLIVAVSVSVGAIPLVSPKFFQHLPTALAPVLNSGILLATLAAVLLNLFFNGMKGAAVAKSA